MASFYACKMVEIHHTKKKFSYIINFILFFYKKMDKFIMISKIELKFLKINLMLKLFLCLKLELLKLFFWRRGFNSKHLMPNFYQSMLLLLLQKKRNLKIFLHHIYIYIYIYIYI